MNLFSKVKMYYDMKKKMSYEKFIEHQNEKYSDTSSGKAGIIYNPDLVMEKDDLKSEYKKYKKEVKNDYKDKKKQKNIHDKEAKEFYKRGKELYEYDKEIERKYYSEEGMMELKQKFDEILEK